MATAVFVGVLLFTAPAHAAAPGSGGAAAVGLNIQSMVRGPQGHGTSFPAASWPDYLRPLSAAGLRVARTDAGWDLAEPDAPAGGQHRYDWSKFDELVADMARAGLRWTPVVDDSPLWASTRYSVYSPPQPGRYPDFAAFAGAFAARYGAGPDGHGGSFWREHPELTFLPVTDY
jgi:hypothetical protein